MIFDRAGQGVALIAHVRRRWQRDRCNMAATSLAFQTALALVPLLAVAFALLQATGQLKAQSSLLQFIAEVLLPSSPEAREEIVTRLASFTENIAAGAMGSLGLVATLMVSFLLFLNVEALWNEIWDAPHKRPFLNRFLLFYASATLVPFLLAVSLWHMASVWERAGILQLVLSWLSTLTVFTLGNRVVPVVRVRWRAALAGGIVSGVLFELAKFGFSLYLARIIGSYRSIYGALGLLPLFLLWIFLGWIIVLLGVEIAHAVQHMDELDVEAATLRQAQEEVVATPELVLSMAGDVARSFARGHKEVSASALCQRHRVPLRVVQHLFQRLVQANIMIEVGDAYLPARPADQIRLSDIVAAVKGDQPDKDGDVLAQIRRQVELQLAALSLQDLI